jgi:hypothetical protein
MTCVNPVLRQAIVERKIKRIEGLKKFVYANDKAALRGGCVFPD